MSRHKIWIILQLSLVVTTLLVTLSWPGKVEAVNLKPNAPQNHPAPYRPSAQADSLAKIEASLLTDLAANGQTEFFVWLTDKADLSPADALPTKAEKGRFVFETLRDTAAQSQKALRQELDRQNLRYQPFYIANKILVQGGNQNTVLNLAARPDVARITANHPYQLERPRINRASTPKVAALESNISFIRADEAWALGYDGRGVVLAGNDTGLDWDHPALINQYRGWNGTTVDHNYSWWDATGTYPNAPGDGYGHGTHTTGTMVGSDGAGNQIGVAPGSKTIHCKNMDDAGGGTDATFIECFEWDLAPWDLTGANPSPALAPDAINNSWGYWLGNQPQFEDEIAALQAAGIVVEVSAGNEGPDCSTLRSPGDYQQSLTTGSVDHASGNLPGTLTYFSSRGQSALFPDEFIPDVMAPGENIRSSIPGGGYEGGWSGTSMAGPHVTGLIGLLWSANPGLRGQVNESIQIILDTSVPLNGQTGSNCGGDYGSGPNNDWGYGTIDALAAVQQARIFGGTGTLAGTVTDTQSQSPIGQAMIQATLSPTLTWQTASDVSGTYTSTVFSGTYTVDVTKYGYLPAQMGNVTVISGATTTLDISLDPADAYTISGYVTDATTGRPLSAIIDIDGYPGESLPTDPVSGFYSISLAAGTGYIFQIRANGAGYTPLSYNIEPLTGDQNQDFELTVDIIACTAPGYTPTYQFFDDFEAGLSQWTASGLWHQEAEADTCGAQAMPFPSPTQAAYYGLVDSCTYADSSPFEGTLTLATPISLPTSGQAALAFSSYEQTECGGNCDWDNRTIEISADGGGSWDILGEGDTEEVWYRSSFDLTPYLGQEVIARFRFDSVDSQYNNYLGWLVDDVGIQTGCVPLTGGHVYGYVYDANTNLPLVGADIATETIGSTTTDSNGFYQLFAPPGTYTMAATTTGGYGSQSQTITVDEDDTLRQDFHLPAGMLGELPPNLAATLQFGEQKTVSFPLTNVGNLATTFTIQEGPGSAVSSDPPPVSVGLHAVGQRHTRSLEKSTEAGPPHETDTSLSASNPDPFGYRYADSNEAAGPSYDWLEIAPPAGGSGIEITQLTGIDDGYIWPLTLPFTFNFYGTDHTEVAIDSNGTVYFEDNYQDFINHPIPNPNDFGVQTFIAPFWDDLVIDPGAVYYQVVDSRLVIEFYQVGHYELPGTVTWQVVLFENGNMLFQYQDVNFDDSNYDQGQSATVGIQGNSATGLQYGYNAPVLADEMAICFAFPGRPTDCPPPDVPWLSVTPDTGTLAPGATQDISVTFDANVAEVMQPGVYAAELRLKPDTPYNVPPIAVTMTITPSGVTLAPTAETKVGQPGSSVAYTLHLTNTLSLSDTYELNVSGNNWPVVTPLNQGANLTKLIIGPLDFGQSEPVELLVLIPADAATEAADTATITVTSQSYPGLSATASLTTVVDVSGKASLSKMFLPVIVK
ncbi:MAG: S8 family serine peptidase [Anaerolineae bacterium]|nr:S8 family serine peptidase [Anaerolineae bacterium]